MFAEIPHAPPADDPLAVLSQRELEVLGVAAQGLTNAEIAGRLGVTVHTVKFHLGSIYRKLGAANRTEAIVRSLVARPARASATQERSTPWT